MSEESKKLPCETCTMRAAYDKNSKSFKGHFWRWHINFCPGWKAYMNSLDDETRMVVAQKYQIKKYLPK